jgi:hypothetical protein
MTKCTSRSPSEALPNKHAADPVFVHAHCHMSLPSVLLPKSQGTPEKPGQAPQSLMELQAPCRPHFHESAFFLLMEPPPFPPHTHAACWVTAEQIPLSLAQLVHVHWVPITYLILLFFCSTGA